jgi:hypothetical protein
MQMPMLGWPPYSFFWQHPPPLTPQGSQLLQKPSIS